MQAKKITLIAIVVLLLIILFQNLDPIPIQLLLWTQNITLLLVILFPFLLGIFVGWLLKTSFAKRKTVKKDTLS